MTPTEIANLKQSLEKEAMDWWGKWFGWQLIKPFQPFDLLPSTIDEFDCDHLTAEQVQAAFTIFRNAAYNVWGPECKLSVEGFVKFLMTLKETTHEST